MLRKYVKPTHNLGNRTPIHTPTHTPRENMITPAPTPRHARTHVPTPTRALRAHAHARTPVDGYNRGCLLLFFGGILTTVVCTL